MGVVSGVATVGLSLLTGMSLLGQSKANASKERLEAMGIQTDGVREVKFVRGQVRVAGGWAVCCLVAGVGPRDSVHPECPTERAAERN